MSRTKASRGELEEELEEKDVQLEWDNCTTEQLKGGGGAGDDNGAERQEVVMIRAGRAENSCGIGCLISLMFVHDFVCTGG